MPAEDADLFEEVARRRVYTAAAAKLEAAGASEAEVRHAPAFWSALLGAPAAAALLAAPLPPNVLARKESQAAVPPHAPPLKQACI